jgi:hypothetical protein
MLSAKENNLYPTFEQLKGASLAGVGEKSRLTDHFTLAAGRGTFYSMVKPTNPEGVP